MQIDRKPMPKEIDDEVRSNAHMLIADCLHSLNTARMTLNRSAAPAPTAPRIGRNDPCPCGSGKKFKKCCLN